MSQTLADQRQSVRVTTLRLMGFPQRCDDHLTEHNHNLNKVFVTLFYRFFKGNGKKDCIIAWPSYADTYWWWQVDFGPGLYSGWGVENWLERYTPQ